MTGRARGGPYEPPEKSPMVHGKHDRRGTQRALATDADFAGFQRMGGELGLAHVLALLGEKGVQRRY